ncbi:MAG: hypothetical protein WAK89_02685 [Candidatus Sulfotelmatobacter sp.]
MTETPTCLPDFLSDISQLRAEQRILVHCRCGAPIETCGKKETCRECGATVEVVRRVSTPNGDKYKLRINKHPWKTEPPLCPLVLHSTASNRPTWRLHGATPTWHHPEPPDHSKGFLDLGGLILLSLLCLIFLSIISAPPQGERPHHYERGPDIHIYDGQRVRTVPNWKRVDD